MDKRLVAEAIQGNPVPFIDNVNGVTLKSDIGLFRIERHPMVFSVITDAQAELASFFALTGNGPASEDGHVGSYE
jgi:hypothetical protein